MAIFLRLLAALEILLFLKKLREEHEQATNNASRYEIQEKRKSSNAEHVETR